MDAVDLVKFQGSKVDSKSNSMESSCIKIKIPENSQSFEMFNQNLQVENPEADLKRHHGNGILKPAQNSSCLKWALCCLTLVVLGALTVCLIALGILLQEAWKDEAIFEAAFQGQTLTRTRNSTNLTPTATLHFLTLSRVERQENEGQKEVDQAHDQVDQVDQVDEGDIWEKVKDITSNITSNEIAQLQQQMRTQHSEIKTEVTTELGDLRGQIADLHLEVNFLGDKLNQKMSLLHDEMKSMLLNFSLTYSAPPMETKTPVLAPPPPVLSAPRFYEHEKNTGAWFEPSSDWEKKCVNMPDYFDKVASSVTLGGHCLFVCAESNCQKDPWVHDGRSGKECIELHSNSYGLESLTKIQYNDQIKSFRRC